jgi:hypothetical protein
MRADAVIFEEENKLPTKCTGPTLAYSRLAYAGEEVGGGFFYRAYLC